MIFSANITVDPSQLTQIHKVEPTGLFKKVLFNLTKGLVADQEEHETFTAVSILQQLNGTFSNLGIDNIVRLSHDDIDFYLDTEGKKGDLQEAFDSYDLKIDESMSTVFNRLNLVLEHEARSIYYLIEIDINRTHKVGEYPIEIKVNGLLSEFKADNQDTADDLKNKMDAIFKNQDSYNAFQLKKEAEFKQFTGELKMAIMRNIRVDDVRVVHKKKLVASQSKVTNRKEYQPTQPTGGYYEPVFYPYFGVLDMLFYTSIWSSMMHDNHIQINDVDVLNDSGELLQSIGDEGLDTADLNVFDEEIPYDEAVTDLETTAGDMMTTEVAGDESSWFDFGGDSDFGGGDFDMGGFD
ncbi:hypothetical protein [Sediminitomix flava]|uniref:Uncharacterized protein n=1 Tax=Sediminitomix flava TaxID=379075 RepID=A0A315Z6U6_SEDFL|nr:hypothetical protein [Sediminitomix flava]PWJ39125.1 hypothetical protein BC781_10626 [Sediminitomix flava]